MLAAEDAPPLAPPTFWSLIGLVVVFWLFARVQLLRRQLASGRGPTTRLGFLHRLAGWPATRWVLVLVAAGLVAVIVATWRPPA